MLQKSPFRGRPYHRGDACCRNAGGCGTPIASLANLIGARLYLAGRSSRRGLWRLFAGVSAALLLWALALSLALVKYSVGAR